MTRPPHPPTPKWCAHWCPNASEPNRVEADRYRELLVQVLEFTERHVSVNSPWTREVREALGLPAAAFDPTYNASAAPSAPKEPRA